MPDQDRCKADKHDSLFVTYTIIDPTFDELGHKSKQY